MIYEGVNLKPSAIAVLIWMRRRGWVLIEDVIRGCCTVAPSKRVSELERSRMVEKRSSPTLKGRKEYRAKEVSQ